MIPPNLLYIIIGLLILVVVVLGYVDLRYMWLPRWRRFVARRRNRRRVQRRRSNDQRIH